MITRLKVRLIPHIFFVPVSEDFSFLLGLTVGPLVFCEFYHDVIDCRF